MPEKLERPEGAKPCPFCGCTDVYLGENPIWDEWEVFCDECRASGSLHAEKADAVTAWNRRSESAEVQSAFDAGRELIVFAGEEEYKYDTFAKWQSAVSGSPKRPEKVCIVSTPKGDGTEPSREQAQVALISPEWAKRCKSY